LSIRSSDDLVRSLSGREFHRYVYPATISPGSGAALAGAIRAAVTVRGTQRRLAATEDDDVRGGAGRVVDLQ
jgi:hypothetical protein